MGMIKTKGIVFRSIKYRETSLIVDIYTRENGLLSFIVNGVRKPKSKMGASMFQHASLVDMVAYHKQGGGLSRIKEIKSTYPYRFIPYEIGKSSVALFMLELARNSIIEEESNYELYDFLERYFMLLDQTQERIALLHIKFMIELTRYIGFYPSLPEEGNSIFNLEAGRYAPAHHIGTYLMDETQSEALATIMQTAPEEVHGLSVHKHVRSGLIDQLIVYYRLHIEGFRPLKSYDVLKQIF